jgi:hypothetical protein
VRLAGIGRYVAVVVPQIVHRRFEIVGNQELILDDQGSPAPGTLGHGQSP